MKSFAFALLAGLGVLGFLACGGTSTTGTTGTGGGSTSATTGAGGSSTTATTGSGGATTTTGSGGSTTTTGAGGNPPMQSGDCNGDADCGASTCEEVTPGGFRVCLALTPEITTCAGGLGGCCKTADCPSGKKCFPPYFYCGGIVGPQNTCYADECQSDKDCKGGSQICVEAGILGRPVKACMPAGCKHDSDCGGAPGGKCQPVDSTCCGDVEGLYCVYAGTGCRHKSDCPGGYCANDGQKSFCMGGSPACPE